MPIAHLRQNKPFPLLYLGHAQIITAVNVVSDENQLLVLGTALGYYMYVEASQGGLWDLASLESPWLRQSAATCVVSFWYHMYGKGIGTLYAYVKVGLTYSRLFEEYGTKG